MRKVICSVLKKELEGLDEVPYPGELGQRIFDNVSRQGWEAWLKRLAIIINENRLSSADPGNIELIEKHMRGFLFEETDLGDLPPGFNPGGGGKK